MIPRHPDDISAVWLTEALQATVPSVTVHEVTVERVVDATNVNATIAVRHDAGDRLPARLFVKLPPLDPQRRERLDWASMGRREVRFYRDLQADLGLRAPAAFVAEVDEMSGEFVLVLELLGQADTRLPDLVGGLDPALLAGAVRDLAELHVRFEEPLARARSAPWLVPSGRTSDYGARLLREGIDRGASLGAAFVAVAERYIADRDLLQDAWERGPATVLHGDAHIGNIFVDERVDPARLGFYDFGLMAIGSPMRDVSYLIAMTLAPADRRATERALIDEYLDARAALGAASIDPDDAWLWHRLQAAYTVVASCQSIVARPTDSAGRRAFSAAFVDRAEQAVADLDTLDAIERFAAG